MNAKRMSLMLVFAIVTALSAVVAPEPVSAQGGSFCYNGKDSNGNTLTGVVGQSYLGLRGSKWSCTATGWQNLVPEGSGANIGINCRKGLDSNSAPIVSPIVGQTYNGLRGSQWRCDFWGWTNVVPEQPVMPLWQNLPKDGIWSGSVPRPEAAYAIAIPTGYVIPQFVGWSTLGTITGVTGGVTIVVVGVAGNLTTAGQSAQCTLAAADSFGNPDIIAACQRMGLMPTPQGQPYSAESSGSSTSGGDPWSKIPSGIKDGPDGKGGLRKFAEARFPDWPVKKVEDLGSGIFEVTFGNNETVGYAHIGSGWKPMYAFETR